MSVVQRVEPGQLSLSEALYLPWLLRWTLQANGGVGSLSIEIETALEAMILVDQRVEIRIGVAGRLVKTAPHHHSRKGR
jgi:hypothetical protein